jgi:hypothetical protein
VSGMTETEERAVVIDGGQGKARVRTEGAAPLKVLLLLFVFPLALLLTGYAAGNAIPLAPGVPSASPAPGIVVATLFFFGAFGVLYIFTRGKEGAASERSFIIEILYNKSSAGE